MVALAFGFGFDHSANGKSVQLWTEWEESKEQETHFGWPSPRRKLSVGSGRLVSLVSLGTPLMMVLRWEE
jgi:hypothetical protein